MLKSAYTGAGLTVGHTPETDEEEEGYYLSSGWWVLWFNAGMFLVIILCEQCTEFQIWTLGVTGFLPLQRNLFLQCELMR